MDEPPPLPSEQPPPLPCGPPPDLDTDSPHLPGAATAMGGGSKEEQLRRKCEFLGLDASMSHEYSAVTASRGTKRLQDSCQIINTF